VRRATVLVLDRGYDYPKTCGELAARGYTELVVQNQGTKPAPGTPQRLTLGLRWIVETTNSWWSRPPAQSFLAEGDPRGWDDRRRLGLQRLPPRHRLLSL
jgi:hypothetical protein